MTSLIDAVGECLVQLGDGNYDGSLAVVDGYLGHASVASDSEPELGPESQHPHGIPIERKTALLSDDNYSESSSLSDVASFRDASSSPFWQDAHFPSHVDDASHARVHTAESVLGNLRQLVQREREWAREKVTYEAYLAQMALELQQSQAPQASAEPSATTVEPDVVPSGSVLAAADGKSESEMPPLSNWWSAFLPAGAAAATVAERGRGISSGSPNRSPPAMAHSLGTTTLPAFMAPPTLSVGSSRFSTPNPACTVVTATGEEACLECIQACERVAEAVLNGDFSARVRCSRCHAVPDDDDTEWPMLPKSGAGANLAAPPSLASTPLISRPATHTQRLANRVNRMASLLSSVTRELVGVARNDGIGGTLGTQVNVADLKGTWFELMSEVNTMTAVHSEQVRNIMQVCTAVTKGDFTKLFDVEARGEMLDLKTSMNGMVSTIHHVANEVTLLAKDISTEGKLGGQIRLGDLQGAWKELGINQNRMAIDLVRQVREITTVTYAVSRGDLTKKVYSELQGEMGDLKNTINSMVDQLSHFADEITRVAYEVGVEGRLGSQARVRNVGGVWKDLTVNVNVMATNITSQVRTISEVTAAVADGDLDKTVDISCRGEMAFLKDTINRMVGRLKILSSEVSRVAKEVGTDGMLGGQTVMMDVDGIWKDVADNVNKMAANLTTQVRDIAKVTKAVAAGDLTQKVTSELNGEMDELKTTINTMVDQLSTFASEVTRVAKEVGTEGILEGQANVEGVGGTWRDLTDN
ncbi:hypothetical protein H4218_004732, partial [Coemansia sp. IMI 209128]